MGFRGGVGGAVATVAAAVASTTTSTTTTNVSYPKAQEFSPQRRLQEGGGSPHSTFVDARNVSASRPAHAELVMAMNVGSDEAYQAWDGTLFAADTLFDKAAGQVRYAVPSTTEIAHTRDDVLYRTEVWQRGGQGVSYHVPLNLENDYNGDFYVEMHWAEIWPGIVRRRREFDVLLEGQTVLRRLDIFAEAQQELNRAVVTTHYPVRVTDGVLDLETVSRQQNSKLSAFSLWKVGDLTPPSFTVTQMIRPTNPMDPLVVTMVWKDDRSGVDFDSVTQNMVKFVSTNSVEIGMEDFTKQLVDNGDDDGPPAVEATWRVHPSHRRPWGIDVVLMQLLQHSVSDVHGNAAPSSTTFVATFASNFDIVEPIVSIRLESPTLATDVLTVRVLITDDRGLASDSVQVQNVLFYGTSTLFQVVGFTKEILSATMMEAAWTVMPHGLRPWSFDSVTIVVVEKSMLDEAGNGNLPKTAQYKSSFHPDSPPRLPVPVPREDEDEDEDDAPPPGPSRLVLVKAVNCGSNEGHLDTSGSNGNHDSAEEDLNVQIFYEADTFDNGNSYHMPKALQQLVDIENAADDVIYHSERWSPSGFTYNVPVEEGGDYWVRLHLAENWFQAPRQRLFHVVVEGQVVAQDLDILARAGGKHVALVLEQHVSVTDGALTISTMRGGADSPKLNAFSIWRQAALSPPRLDNPLLDVNDDASLPRPFVPFTPVAAATAFSHLDVSRFMETPDDFQANATGEVLLRILKGVTKVQKSNFGRDSFRVTNTGTKRIAALFIDVSAAIVPDVVFDHDGTGGDSVAKTLKYDEGEQEVDAVSIQDYPWRWLPARDASFDATVPFDPTRLQDVNNLFVDELANSGRGSPAAGGGFRGELLVFENFGPGKEVTFSGDMDPNSVAGLSKPTIDHLSHRAGFSRNFDVGGVSGAEMSGSVVTVLFGDASTATAEIVPDGSQAGAVAYVKSDLQAPPVLLVNGVAAGGFGTYGVVRPNVTLLEAPPGVHVRVSLVKAMDPTGNVEDLVGREGANISVQALVEARLVAQYPQFPVNNAVEWQHVVVRMPPEGMLDISHRFNYHQVKNARDTQGPFDGHDTLALGFVAVVIDRSNRSLPLSHMSAPIRLLNQGGPVVED